nr:uncharacterized protein LOC123766868 [Procambarus clarkii]
MGLRLNTRVAQGAVFASLVGACLLYYLSGVTPLRPSGETPPHTPNSVGNNDTWRVLSVRLSQSEIESLLQATPRSFSEPRVLERGTHAGESATASPDQGGASGEEAACSEVGAGAQDPVQDGCCEEDTKVSWAPPVLKPSEGSFLRNFNFSAFPPEARKYLRSRLGEMVERTRLVADGCRLRSKLASSSALRVLWNTEQEPNLVWCPVFKRSRCSGARFLFPPSRPAKVNLEAMTKLFQSSVRVLVVADPLLRLLSIYLDKIATDSCQQQFQEMKRQIIKKYRKNKKANLSLHPSFPEFLQHVLDSTRILHTHHDWTTKAPCWMPYYIQCNVCAADYDLVLKMETLEDDHKFLLALINTTEFQKLEVQRSGGRVPAGQAVNRYLGQLDRKQISLVYHRFMLDAELFGYSSDAYLHLAHE